MIKEAHLWLHFESYLKTYPNKSSTKVIRVIRGSLNTKIDIDTGRGHESRLYCLCCVFIKYMKHHFIPRLELTAIKHIN